MEANRDAADTCLDRAKVLLEKNDVEGAKKYVLKAQQLYPSLNADSLLIRINQLEKSKINSDENPNNSAAASSSMEKKESSSEKNKEKIAPKYTPEQLSIVKRTKEAKDLYEVLKVERSATTNELKTAYKQLAQKLHPDKNNAPGAEDAFKRVSHAYQVLSETESRAHYDRFGEESQESIGLRRRSTSTSTMYRSGNGTTFYSSGEMTPEELFEMFFSGAFSNQPGFSSVRRSTSRSSHPFHQQTRRTNQNQNESQIPMALILQFLPFLILILVSILSIFSNDSVSNYSLERTNVFSIPKQTQRGGVYYYVAKDFDDKVLKSHINLNKFERQIETEMLQELAAKCNNEQLQKQRLIERSKAIFMSRVERDRLRNRAEKVNMMNCEKYANLRKRVYI
uniref:J domain-containing protein n=1 Tax=Timspurckia oligopyrenoides TaxID=708627 RepID=A0A7S1EQJ6_9RHOD|mmetsp:Transcript_12763/g.22942  ORF Transcript_12763/g.22942 Transcript_12763/m.22942 type:complete len:396 (+) Transcript_12763:67-1254(+)